MNKKVMCIVLSLVLLALSVVPAFAVETSSTHAEECAVLEDQEYQSYIEEFCDSYTITFEDELSLSEDNAVSVSSLENEANSKENVKSHNELAAQEAIEYVDKLNLSEKGWETIENTCIDELNYYATLDEAKLLSYTVHVPKSNASISASSPPSGYFYFGEYGGKTFYFYYPSDAGFVTNVCKETSTSNLQKWVNSALTLYTIFGPTKTATAWSVIQLLMGVSSNYTVRNGAFLESYCNVQVKTRGIYTLYGNGSYQMVTSQQFGSVFPYVVFHPCDPPKYNGAFSKDYGYQGQVFSPKYKNTTTDLCKEAWQAYNGAVVLSQHDKVSLSSCKQYFK